MRGANDAHESWATEHEATRRLVYVYTNTQSNEEAVDVMPAIRKQCEPKCTKTFSAYRACLDRVKAKGVGACDGQYYDFLHCIDKCSVPQIMKHLK
ncbi:hypothetical protein PsorP6_015738 [Peronosclerospora sorghi]|uniref:Uncharacterized protein n=1 Tax=Peronosclerospora sorghi TaxID=230839 RepID=A0ACC0WNX5_9STRA|nr:hypothetical protein PsorP6_015738 [Peronosclerospora sorghi]